VSLSHSHLYLWASQLSRISVSMLVVKSTERRRAYGVKVHPVRNSRICPCAPYAGTEKVMFASIPCRIPKSSIRAMQI
jgi:hypothetical protein